MKRTAAAISLAVAVWAGLLMASTPLAHAQYPEATSAPALYPEATSAPVATTGDLRSDGAGPGLVGSPVLIALGVVALGLCTIVGTTIVIRVSRR